ncbi:hypothetical protein [Nodularia sp. UHCC 0506]|uniref:hypothetical protein n=1 Tax=Nodularia sp. UHCC 0506 TaxID=3110243 RepID=UPI002B21CAB1|nr:hypothetical protein [Nodularia sp. UHCC 0506]MEA5513463.1 hypothetical protein [Nodularia sp. UHCC 0506]
MRSQYTDYHPVSIYAFGKFAKSALAKLTRGDRCLGVERCDRASADLSVRFY